MLARTIAVVSLAAAVLASCGGCSLLPVDAGPQVTRERQVADASAVLLRTSGELTITRGESASLTTTAGERVFEALTFDVVDGVLVLDSDGPVTTGFARIRYELTLPELEAVRVEGSGDVTGDFSGVDDVEVDIRGSGDVEGTDLDADTVTVSVSGSGDVRLRGSTGDQSVSIRGSGDYEGRRLDSQTATVSIAGSGDAELTVRDSLDVTIAGSGSVRHTGGARVDTDVSGSGDVSEY